MLPVLLHTQENNLSHFYIKTRRGTYCLGNVIIQLSRNLALKSYINLCIIPPLFPWIPYPFVQYYKSDLVFLSFFLFLFLFTQLLYAV